MTTPDSRRDVVAAATTSTGGHNLDPWIANLDEIYAQTPFADGTPIDWGLLFEANPEPWTPPGERILIDGADWRVVFLPPGGIDPRHEHSTLNVPSCVVVAAVHASSVSEAQRRGRTVASRAAAVTSLKSRYIVNLRPLWEGPVAQGDTPGKLRFGSATTGVKVPTRGAQDVRDEFAPFLPVSLESLPQHVGLAMYWYGHGWERLDLVDRFAAFWWAALSLIESTRRPGRSQRERIKDYADSLVVRFAVAPARADSVNATLSGAYGVRNQLFHESRPDAVTRDVVTEIEKTLSEILTWEVLHR